MFLLYGVEAQCGEECCIVWADGGRNMIMDRSGGVLAECKRAAVHCRTALCTMADDIASFDLDSCRREECPEGRLNAVLMAAGYAAGARKYCVLPGGLWVAIVEDVVGAADVVAVKGEEVLKLGKVDYPYDVYGSVAAGVAVLETRYALYLVAADKLVKFLDLNGIILFGGVPTACPGVGRLTRMAESLEVSVLFPGFYAGAVKKSSAATAVL
jgi:hypothetical protein